MTPADIVFWTLIGVLAFSFALAVQMRIFTALVLRRALLARDDSTELDEAAAAVRFAAAPKVAEVHPARTLMRAQHLVATYPRPLAHLRMARRWSVFAPILLLVAIVARRLISGEL